MKTLFRIITVITISLTAGTADEQSSKILRDALFAEEANQDYKTATEKYETLLANFDKERQIAATALYRLAEIHRKQGKKSEASALYKRILTEFPNAEIQVRLSRENLTALGEKAPEQPLITLDEEAKELARLKKLEVTSPDLFKLTKNLENAAKNNHLRIIAYLISKNQDINQSAALAIASGHGHLSACKMLLDAGCDLNSGENSYAVEEAFIKGHTEVIKLLLKRGANVKGHKWLPSRIEGDTPLSLIKLIVEAGYDVNTSYSSFKLFGNSGNFRNATTVGLLQKAICISHDALVDYLLEKKVDVNLTVPKTGLTALHIAAFKGDQVNALRLIKAGAKVNSKLTIPFPQNDKGIQQATPLAIIFSNLFFHRRTLTPGHHSCIKILLENNSELPSNIITDMVKHNQVDLIKLFVHHGADLHLKNPESTWGHVALALNHGDMECALYLVTSGVTLHPNHLDLLTDKHLKRLSPLTIKIRETIMHKQLYPEFAKRKGITLTLPEIFWHSELLPAPASTSEIASQINKQELPQFLNLFDENDKSEKLALADCDLVQCSLIRQGKRTRFNLLDEQWPEFISGDIIELKQFKISSERRKILAKTKPIKKQTNVEPPPSPRPRVRRVPLVRPMPVRPAPPRSHQLKRILSKHLTHEIEPDSAPDKK